MSSTNKKRHFGILALALTLLAVLIIGTVAVFSDRVNQTVKFTVATFSKDGYTLERTAPEGYFVAGESVATTITEKNASGGSMNATLTMSAVWSSPDPNSKLWGNPESGDNAVLKLDGAVIPYTVKADGSISFTLPQVSISAGLNSKRQLTLEIPTTLNGTGSLSFSFDKADVQMPGTQWVNTYSKLDLNNHEDLGFSVGIVWNISKDQTTKDIIAYLAGSTGTYDLEIVKNGKSGNTNGSKMMDFTITKTADTSADKDDAGKWVSSAPWYGYHTQIKNVTLPDSLTSIGDGAFLNLTAWSGPLTIPSAVTMIGEGAFGNAGGLTAVTIPNSVKTMESYAFISCQGVQTIKLGSGLYEIFEKTFFDNLSLKSIDWGTSKITAIGKSAFERAGQKTGSLTSLTLPDSVKTISERAFADTHGLQTIHLNKVVTIEANAFEEALKLTEITIPVSVKDLGQRAFYNCYTLVDITFDHPSTGILTLPDTDDQHGAFRLDDRTDVTPVKTSVYTQLTKAKTYQWLEDNRLLKGEPILKQYFKDTTVDFHAYKDTATKITVMDHYAPPATLTAGPWDVSAAGDESVMAYMSGTEIFICSNVYSWTDPSRNVNANVIANEISSYLFQGFTKVTEIQVTALDTANATDMSSMFDGCEALKTLDVSGFITDKVVYFSDMFARCGAVNGLDVSQWKTDSAEYMNGLFFGCSSLTSLDLADWNTKKVVSIESMFSRCAKLTASCGMENWEMPNLEIIGMAFASSGFQSLDLSSWKVKYLVDAYMAFTEATSLKTVDLSGWKTLDGATMQLMFRDCSALETVDLTDFDPSGVESMRSTFASCTSLKNVIINEWNAESCTTMYGMFQNCSALESFSTDNWFTENVKMTYQMFSGCSSMKVLDLSDFNSRKVTSADSMFSGMVLLDTVTLGPDFVFKSYGKLPVPSATYIPAANGNWYNTSTWDKYTPTQLVTAHTGLVTYTAYPPVLDSIEIVTPPDTVEYAAGSDFDPTGMEVRANYKHSKYPDHSRMLASDEYTIPDGKALVAGKTYVTASYTEDGVTKTDAQPITVKLAVPMLAANTRWYKSDVAKNNITSISLVDTYNTSGKTIVEQWDASDSSVPGTVTAYLESDGSTGGTYKLTIAGNGYGKIFANPDSEDAFSWFENMTALTGLVTGSGNAFLDTSKVTTMNAMFFSCYKLVSMDVSKFDTSQVEDFSSMFHNCRLITALDVGNFNTGKGKNFQYMFGGCKNLASLDVSKWNTSSAENFTYFFNHCEALTTLNVTNWNVQKVKDTSAMFQGCKKLATLDVSKWTFTSALIDTGFMFSGCNSLTALDVSNWYMSAVTNTEYMFSGCYLLTTLPVDNWNVSSVKYMYSMFNVCEDLVSLNVSKWDVSSAIRMDEMFYGCKSLPTLAVDNWNVSNVKNMAAMFHDCYGLISLNVSKWNTASLTKVTTVSGMTKGGEGYSYDVGMFEGCKKLEVIDISGWNMSGVKNNAHMFSDCISLKTLTVPASATYISPEFAYNCTSLTDITFLHAAGATVNMPNAGKKTAEMYLDETVDENGVFSDGGAFYVPSYLATTITTSNETIKAYGWAADNRAKVLPVLAAGTTWYSQGGTTISKSSISSITLADTYDVSGKTIVSQWDASDGKIGSVTAYVEDDGLGTGTYKLTLAGNGYGNIIANKKSYDAFSFGSKLQSINNLTLLDTSNATTMNGMFDGNSGLTSLDLSKFNTANVTDFFSMFDGCKKLQTLDLSSFKTENATAMGYMFNDCTSLSSLNISSFKTNKVTSFGRMFRNCESLTVLDLRHFETPKLTSLYATFQGCKRLTTLDVSSFTTNLVTDMTWTFQGCKELSALDVSNFNTSSCADMHGMFMDCEKVENLSVSHFVTNKVTDMGNMFASCESITTLDVSNFVTSNVTNFSHMFSSVAKVASLDLSNFDTSKATSMQSMFSHCFALHNLDISNFNTALVEDMSYMFQACSNLTSLDLRHFNTENVTTMYYMFASCTQLSSVDLSSFNTEKVTTMGQMFALSTALTNLDLSNFRTPLLTSMTGMFKMQASGTALRTLDISGFDVSSVTGMKEVFLNCHDLVVTVADSAVKTWCESLADLPSTVTFVAKVSGASTMSLDFDASNGSIDGYSITQ